jgi:hypothetical protein
MSDDDVRVKISAQVDELLAGLNLSLSGLNETFSKLSQTAEQASSVIEKNLGAATEKSAQHAKEMKEQFAGVGETIDDLRSKFNKALEFAGISIAIELAKKLVEELNEIAERAEDIQSTAQAFNITTREMQGLEAVAAKTGATFEQLKRGTLSVQAALTAAAGGSEEARAKLERVGISLGDVYNPAFTAADALVKMGQSGASNAAILDVLGTRSASLVGAIRALKEGWDGANDAAEKSNALSAAQIEILEKYHAQVAQLNLQWENFKATLAAAVIPALESIVKGFADVSVQSSGLEQVMTGVGFVLKIIVELVYSVVLIFRDLFLLIVDGWTMASNAGANYAKVVVDILTFQFKKALDDSKSFFATLAADWKKTTEDIALNAVKTAMAVQDLWKAMSGHGEEGGEDRPDPGKARNPVNVEITPFNVTQGKSYKGIEDQRKIDRQIGEQHAAQVRDQALFEISMQEMSLQQQLQLREISAQDFLQKERELSDKKLAIQIEYFDSLKKLYYDSSADYEKIDTQTAKAQQDSALERVKLERQVALQVQRDWMQILRPVVDQFARGIEAMLRGTLTLSQAFHNVLNSMLTNLIRTTTQAVGRWIASERAKTAATAAGAQTRESIEAGAQKKGMLAAIASSLKEIYIAAYTAAANVYKSVSAIPYVGWALAPVAAAATFAVVAGYGAAVASAKGGMWEVPGDQMAQIHRKESVLPANIAEPMREFFSTGQGARGGSASKNAGGGRFELKFVPVGRDHGLVRRDELAGLVNELVSRFAL